MFLKIAQQTTQILETKVDELKTITWNNGEANLDLEYSNLACSCAEEAWEHVKHEYPEYSGMTLKANSPDINLVFTDGTKVVLKGKIELKSRTTTTVLGSTIKDLDINQPIIFCKRNDKSRSFEFRYAQYHMCMGNSNTDLFQDRTPRPMVNFTKMFKSAEHVDYVEKEKDDWIQHYAKCAVYRINPSNSCPYSWQDDLTRGIIKNFIETTSIEEFTRLKAENS